MCDFSRHHRPARQIVQQVSSSIPVEPTAEGISENLLVDLTGQMAQITTWGIKRGIFNYSIEQSKSVPHPEATHSPLEFQ
jgi:hypothetical protein